MEIHIKNMVCARCIKTVTGIFNNTGVPVKSVRLGIAETSQTLSPEQEQKVRLALTAEGFEWLDDQKVKLVEEIKQAIIQLVHYGELDEMKTNLSAHLSSELNKDYHYLGNVFSSVENTTIEQYFILQKIERVKEWLGYD